jgi:uncharacterized protein (TIGR04255 family)
MAWTLPLQPHRVFERNPLVAVVVELRFFPILKIPAKVADFQENVRARFPAFQEARRQIVTLGPAPVEIRTEQFFTFTRQDESATLTLSTSSLSLESRRHDRRENFIADVKVGLDGLSKACGPIALKRLGLRYVDVIDREQIEKDLGRATSWDRLISARFASVPAGIADTNGTLFACEVASPMTSSGAQTVRYGLVKDADTRIKFRLDVDRYREEAVDPGSVVTSLNSFADDIFAVFVSAMGPDLLEWMPERKETRDAV